MHRSLSTVLVRFYFKINGENTGVIILACMTFCMSKAISSIFNASFRKTTEENSLSDLLVVGGNFLSFKILG